MTTPAVKPKSTFTEEEYLLLEEHAQEKSEFYDGEIFAMSGASIDHVLICSNIGRLVSNFLLGQECLGLGSDARVAIPGKSYLYPDYTIVCPPIDIHKIGNQEAITNPVIIFEVLSDLTADFDRSGKFELYKTITSLRQYILVDSRSVDVTSFVIDEQSNWQVEKIAHQDTVNSLVKHSQVSISEIGLKLDLNELYRNTSFF